MTEQLSAVPYDTRRLITVVNGSADLPEAANDAATVVPVVPPKRGRSYRRLAATVLFGPAGVAAAGALHAAIKLRVNQPASVASTVLPVTHEQAAELELPVGHPRTGIVYAGHPLAWRTYVPVANFHRFLFEHKVAEALRLIRALGATSIEVQHVEGWDNASDVSAGLRLPASAPVDVSASGGQRTSGATVILSRMELEPHGDPFLPDGLAWYAHEPLWQEVVGARMEAGLKSFSLDVRSTDDFGINASVKAAIMDVGLEVGGSYVEHRATTWRLAGRFASTG